MAANVQSMCDYWKKFDLQDLQKDLDLTATELANRQDESDISRKRLVEQSREFKRGTPEDIRKVVAPLLKSFQIEVDSLSKRSKAAEAAFLSVYKKLIDVPDPIPVLEYAIQAQKKAQRVQDYEIENKQLRETLDEYNHEFAEVKNQEVTIKQLREKLKDYEEKLESTADARAKEKERELQRIFTEKERQLQGTQLSVAQKLGEAEHRVTTLQTALESLQSELFEVKSKYDETSTAKSDEMEMVMADLERANERAAAAEREASHLRQQLTTTTQSLQPSDQPQKSPDMEQAIDILKRSNMEVELAAKEKEIQQLVEDVQRLQASLSKLRETTSQQIAKLEEALENKTKAFQLLENKVKSQDDYEEIHRELNVLKSIEFNNLETNEENSSAKSLEVLLLEKNKQLQSENTQLKVASKDVTGNSENPTIPNADSFASILNEDTESLYKKKAEKSSTPNTPSTPSPPVINGLPPEEPPTPTSTHSSTMSEGHHIPAVPPYYFGNGHMLPMFFGMPPVKHDPNGSNGLDTIMVAKTVREILSIHNIGQRLFAKHVLGLSQGTVSELLSKPKSWDKLTEKGRESYRKMHAWAIDERNILSLKAISPKKGSQPLLPSVKHEDTHTEERIQQILSDAQQAMQIKKAVEQVGNLQQVASAMVASIYNQELNKLSASLPNHSPLVSPPINMCAEQTSPNSLHRKIDRSVRNATNCETEKQAAQEMVTRIYREELMKLAQAAENAGNIAASTMYQKELSRLSQGMCVNSLGIKSDNGQMPNGCSNVKSEPPDSTSDDIMMQSNGPIDLSKRGNSSPDDIDSVHHQGSAFFSVHPRSNSQEGFPPNTISQAECMSPLQRMQNIANSLTSRPNLNSPTAKPLRAVLPPITQEEFDAFSNVNTDDLVKKVKETLSQYSISQRLFGENVLGLSQGSVSDLLARPKPWHMLTQKGREPFIRMQIFLEDAEAIPKLVASQYRIPPEKLMRGNSRTENIEHFDNSRMERNINQIPLPGSASIVDMHHEPRLHPPFSFPSSTLEVIAMTSEIDTLEITSRVRDILQFHNLGQKLFGEAVLALSQGSVSELLSKPKPWHMLSIKGREPFIKMHLWLNDPLNVDRLKHYQSELKAQRKRRHSSLDERGYDSSNAPKRPRVFFSEEQKDHLRAAYTHDPYPNQNTIESLANELNVGVKTVINWFHNHRMRAKQQQHASNQNGSDCGSVSIKSEPPDDNSNGTDDMSDLSEENNPFQNSQGINETSQWMFPQFELVKNLEKQAIERCNAESESADKCDNKNNSEEQFNRSLQRQVSLSTVPPGVNKRKRSMPQYVSEGRILDKTHTVPNSEILIKPVAQSEVTQNGEIDMADEAEEDEIFEDGEDKNSDCSNNYDSEYDIEEESDELRKERINKIEKLQKSIQSSEDTWEEDVDKGVSIEKLQKNLESQSEEEWEF